MGEEVVRRKNDEFRLEKLTRESAICVGNRVRGIVDN